jgi:hypothetical protein
MVQLLGRLGMMLGCLFGAMGCALGTFGSLAVIFCTVFLSLVSSGALGTYGLIGIIVLSKLSNSLL